MEEITGRLKAKAHKLGFSQVGVIEARPGRRLDAYLRWVAQEHHGEMDYLARPDRLARRQDLNVVLPGVQSIICVGLDYATLQLPPEIANDPSRGRISNYAWGADYHDLLLGRLEELAAWLHDTVGAHRYKVYVDTGAILERDHAETAGLGFTSKNTMLIAPRRGSYLFLGEILTTLALPPDPPAVHVPSCGNCHRCLDACPTQAFPEPYVLDARRCISYLTIELKGWIPHELRPLMGNWVYGCDVCQVVCPFNRFARPTQEVAFWPGSGGAGEQGSGGARAISSPAPLLPRACWGNAAPPLLELLALDEAAFERRFAHSPIRRIKRRGLVRNVCVAAGNWGNPAAIPALIALLADPEPLVRGHAAWALGRIGGEEATAAITLTLASETDEEARQEMVGGLSFYASTA